MVASLEYCTVVEEITSVTVAKTKIMMIVMTEMIVYGARHECYVEAL